MVHPVHEMSAASGMPTAFLHRVYVSADFRYLLVDKVRGAWADKSVYRTIPVRKGGTVVCGHYFETDMEFIKFLQQCSDSVIKFEKHHALQIMKKFSNSSLEEIINVFQNCK